MTVRFPALKSPLYLTGKFARWSTASYALALPNYAFGLKKKSTTTTTTTKTLRLRLEFLKWAKKHLCDPITNLVARGGYPTSWTTNIFQNLAKETLGNYTTKMLGTIFGKLYGFILENIIS